MNTVEIQIVGGGPLEPDEPFVPESLYAAGMLFGHTIENGVMTQSECSYARLHYVYDEVEKLEFYRHGLWSEGRFVVFDKL